MKCESCGNENASIHMTSIVNGVKEEHHYCPHCANQHDTGTGSMFSSMFDDTFFNNQFFHFERLILQTAFKAFV